MFKRLSGAVSFVKYSLFFATMSLAFFVPIYTDELITKMQTSRYFLDGFRLMYFFPDCIDSFEGQVPWPLLPMRAVDALLYSDLGDPLKLRILGELSFLLWCVFTCWGLARLRNSGKSVGATLREFITPFSLGVLPFLMVLNRVEQTLLWGISFAVFYPALLRPLPKDKWFLKILKVALYFWVCATFFSYHPKSFFFAPLWFVSAWYSFGPLAIRLLSWAFTVFYVVVEASFQKPRAVCPQSPILDYLLRVQYMQPRDFFQLPLHFIQHAFENLCESSEYLHHILFQARYSNNWLPPVPVDEVGMYNLDFVSIAVNIAIFALFSCAVFYLAVTIYLKLKSEVHDRRISYQSLVQIFLYMPLIIIAMLQKQKVHAFYESPFVMPILLLSFFLRVSPGQDKVGAFFQKAWNSGGKVALDVVACLSMAVLLGKFAPYAFSSWSDGGFLPKQTMSFSAFRSEELNDRIRALGANCGLNAGDALPLLIVDNITYAAYHTAYRPLLAFYQFDWTEDPNLLRTMIRDGSAGLITHCANIPLPVALHATTDGEYCCFPAIR